MVAATARYIGLRTYRYSPPATRRSGGATGAGVPRPSTTKRQNACRSTATPAARSTRPATRKGAQYGNGSRTRQPVNAHGTRPATIPGASTRNTRLASAARAFRTVTFCFEALARLGAAHDREAPRLPGGEELVGVDVVAPAEEVLGGVIGRRAVHRLAGGRLGSGVVALGAF